MEGLAIAGPHQPIWTQYTPLVFCFATGNKLSSSLLHSDCAFFTCTRVAISYTSIGSHQCSSWLWAVLFQDVKNALVEERERLFAKLQEIPFLEPYPSHANFILCSVTGSRSAKELKVKTLNRYLVFFIPALSALHTSVIQINVLGFFSLLNLPAQYFLCSEAVNVKCSSLQLV